MRSISILALLFIFSLKVYPQNVNCDSLAKSYYKIDSITPSILSFFCEGMEEALEYDELAIRALGDPSHLSSCDLFSYKYYGVKLQLTGDIVLDGQEQKNDGFNAVMISRIKDSLGADYEKLGKIDSSWIVLGKNEFMRELSLIFYYGKNETDSTITLFIDSIALKNSIFKTFEGVQIKTIKKEIIKIEDFYGGKTIPKLRKDRTYLSLNFDNYSNPNKVCEATGRWTIPYPFMYSNSKPSNNE